MLHWHQRIWMTIILMLKFPLVLILLLVSILDVSHFPPCQTFVTVYIVFENIRPNYSAKNLIHTMDELLIYEQNIKVSVHLCQHEIETRFSSNAPTKAHKHKHVQGWAALSSAPFDLWTLALSVTCEWSTCILIWPQWGGGGKETRSMCGWKRSHQAKPGEFKTTKWDWNNTNSRGRSRRSKGKNKDWK